jgi:perosamine synthetase
MSILKKKIYYTKPSISDLEINYAADAVANGWGDQCYSYIHRFEDLFKRHLGTQYAIATSSCTGALHMGMYALDIGPGDEVIMADINWIATASPIVHLGAKPIFVDILEDTWCIDPDKVEAAITSRTKAIVAVHLYGNLCDMDRLLEIGKKYGIPVIEDAAEAIGSIYKGVRAGSMGTFGVFSFHGSKTITAGEGGIFVTNNGKLYEKVVTLSNHGRARTQIKQFWPDVIGFKYKMSNIQAAIGCAQMERIEKLIKKKREILSKYKINLKDFDGIKMNPEPKGTINGAWMPTVVFDKYLNISREKIINCFKKENIDARVFFWPLSSLPMFEAVNENFNARSISSRAINLPSFHDILDEEIQRICEIIKKNIVS